MKNKPILSDSELETIILMALEQQPQTEEQLDKVINEAREMRFNAALLDLVLSHKLSMFVDGEDVCFASPSRDQARPDAD